jgi:hypothetical protein
MNITFFGIKLEIHWQRPKFDLIHNKFFFNREIFSVFFFRPNVALPSQNSFFRSYMLYDLDLAQF